MDEYRPTVVQLDESEIVLKRKSHLWKPERQDPLSQLGYTVYEVIGQGLFTKVKRAHSRRFNRDEAVKIIAKQKIAAEFLSKFLPREIYLHQRLLHPHLIDTCYFGLARLSNRTEHCSTPCGSYVYAAPEVMGGELYDAYKADLRSLGITIHVNSKLFRFTLAIVSRIVECILVS
ncbi:testis-specific serine/threonine-protein kinase 6-like [Tubulanus polymorphus]|uniref:testis-specific serine/threonine-protein kinase 6-like n=1 Tax=Tubulanus polymorphus TaxID=672921 RepID=UPI003DA25FC4